MSFLKNILLILLLIASVSCSRENITQIEGMVYIPAGEFIMGGEEVDTESLGKEFGARAGNFYEDERPIRKVYLNGFYIDKYELTNQEYKIYIDSTGFPALPGWTNRMYPSGRENHPVMNITWYDANMYCLSIGKRLPTEAEWEKAARGPNGNKYSWGNEYDEKKANMNKGDTVPAGSYETDKSYYGVYDMTGNVMEWVQDWYEPYPGNTMQNKEFGRIHKVLRGGIGRTQAHYIIISMYSRNTARHFSPPNGFGDDAGFRCAKSPIQVKK